MSNIIHADFGGERKRRGQKPVVTAPELKEEVKAWGEGSSIEGLRRLRLVKALAFFNEASRTDLEGAIAGSGAILKDAKHVSALDVSDREIAGCLEFMADSRFRGKFQHALNHLSRQRALWGDEAGEFGLRQVMSRSLDAVEEFVFTGQPRTSLMGEKSVGEQPEWEVNSHALFARMKQALVKRGAGSSGMSEQDNLDYRMCRVACGLLDRQSSFDATALGLCGPYDWIRFAEPRILSGRGLVDADRMRAGQLLKNLRVRDPEKAGEYDNAVDALDKFLKSQSPKSR